MTDAELEAKANRIQAVVEDHLVQEHGMLPMLVRVGDYQLPTEQDYRGAYRHRHLRGMTEAEVGMPPMHVWRAWENTPTDTAWYLGAMSYRYRCDGDPRVLAICRRTLAALRYIHELGVEKGERGYMCKPYGGVYSNQSSGDQVQCILVGLAAYRPIAPPDDLAAIDGILVDMAEFDVKWNYVSPHGYFGYTHESLVETILGENWINATWSYAIIHTPLLYLAWRAAGDPRYLREIGRWYEACDTSVRFERPSGKLTGGIGWRALYLPALLMEFDPANHVLWRGLMLQNYDRVRSGILPNGTQAYQWTFDVESGEREILPAALWGAGPAATGRSGIFARACVAAQPWFRDEAMASTARHILETLDLDTFRFIMPLVENQAVPPEWTVETRLLDMDSLTGWLWGYWEGKWRGYW